MRDGVSGKAITVLSREARDGLSPVIEQFDSSIAAVSAVEVEHHFIASEDEGPCGQLADADGIEGDESVTAQRSQPDGRGPGTGVVVIHAAVSRSGFRPSAP